MSLLKPTYINGLTVLGGEPFEPRNQLVLYPFLKRVREVFPDKSIWMFSGFTFEELTDSAAYPNCEVTENILRLADVLIDGRYDESLKSIALKFRGSSNQRIINLPETLNSGKVTLWE